MKILFLDDERYRHNHIRRSTKGKEENITHIWDGLSAIKELQNNLFDLIMLDHDLGIENGKEEVCGLDVAKSIIAMGDRHKNATIVIHSLNPIGAKNMFLTLDREGFDVYEIPHAWMMLEYRANNLVIDTTKKTDSKKMREVELDDELW